MAVTHKLCYSSLCLCSRIRNIIFDNCFESSIASGYYTTILMWHVEIWINWIQRAKWGRGGGRWQMNSTRKMRVDRSICSHQTFELFWHCFVASSHVEVKQTDCVRDWFILFSINELFFFLFFFLPILTFAAAIHLQVNNIIFRVNFSDCSCRVYGESMRALPSFGAIYLLSAQHIYYLPLSSVRFAHRVVRLVLCRLFPLCSRYRLDID